MNGSIYIYIMRLLLDCMMHARTHSRTRAFTSTFQCIVQYLVIAQIGLCHSKLAIFNEIAIQCKTPICQVDKQTIDISRVNKRPSEIFVNLFDVATIYSRPTGYRPIRFNIFRVTFLR